MHIENVGTRTPEQLTADLKGMDDAEVIAQEIAQKASMHVLLHILRTGTSESDIRSCLRSIERMGELISAECRRRGLGVVDHPASN